MVLPGLVAVTLIVGLWFVARRVVPTRPTNTHLADDFDLHPYERYDGTAAEDS